MDDLISRQAAMDAPEKLIKDCNPDHFVGQQKFIEFMDNAEIGSFGNWQFANGFNMGLTAAEVAIKNLPSAQPEIIHCRDCKHWDKTWTNDWHPDYHYCPLIDGVRKGDFYCADGERRTDERHSEID